MDTAADGREAARMSDRHRDHGRFVWFELLTTDPLGAVTFYGDVVGWHTQPFELPGATGPTYTMWVTGQGPLGGVTELPENLRAMGVPSNWQGNVMVTDIDASVAQVKQLGGRIWHQEDVPTIGRLAVIGDPQGAVISLYQPESEVGPRDLGQPGELQWHELYTSDVEAAFAFYQQVAGWERMGEVDMGPMGSYLLWGRDGRQLGGMMKLPPGMKTPDGREVPPSWMYYVTVDDLDAALERARGKGATVLNGPMEVPGGQRIVQLLDPQGAAISLLSRAT